MEAVVRFHRITAVFALLVVAVSLAQPALAAEDEWEFDGGGWGHGVGLSQFGALGQAEDGRNATQILQHYYSGTSVTSMGSHWSTQQNSLWVGLVSNTTSVTLSAVEGMVSICQPHGTCPAPANGAFNDVTIDPGESWRFEVDPGNPNQCRFRKVDVDNLGYKTPCDAAITGLGPSNRVVVNGQQYGRGIIRFTPAPQGFHAVVTLDLEQYLYGLAEVPSSWPSEALKAQAIIGRSYAVATAAERGGADGSGKLSSCGCHLRSTTADQAYAGWAKETGSFANAWRGAVNDTAGAILVHPQSNYAFDIAKAFYSSSNGGHSEDVEFVWGGEALPWLRSVEDGWSSDPSINPLARWTVVVPTTNIETYLGWDSVTLVEVTSGPPGAVVRFTGRDNGQNVSAQRWGDPLRLFLVSNAYRRDGAAVRVSPYVISVTYTGRFLDIAGHIFENAITWMAEEQITVGCNPPAYTNFCPGEAVTRGQMAVFISRVMGLPSPTGDYFDDDTGKFYESAANRLFEAGITVGCGADRYCGDRSVSREQMAAFLARTLGLPTGSTDHFVDDDGSQFESAIDKIADAQITLGCNPPTNDRFCPTENVTRGQMAAFFRRVWGP
jgi:hypothetical protein